MKRMQKLISLILLLLIFGSCAFHGKYTINSSPPYVDYFFLFGKFSHSVNGDTYGEYGKGNYSYRNDTLILQFKDLKDEESLVKVDIETKELDQSFFSFKILGKNDKLSIPGANVDLIDRNNTIIKKGQANIEGLLNLQIEKDIIIDRVVISFIAMDTIEIERDFSSKNNIYVEWHSDWLKIIENTTEKYKVLNKRKHWIDLETEHADTFSLIRKRILNRFDKGKITWEEFKNKIK